MLVLARKPGESITVKMPDGSEITFKVLSVIGNKSRIGIDAPRVCKVLRTELEESLEWAKRGAK